MAEQESKSGHANPEILPVNTDQKGNRRPISLITGLLVAVAIISPVASACILLISNNQSEVTHIQPTVLLAIFSSSFNTALGFLLSTGLAITWWRTVQHETSLTHLQHIWDAGLPSSFRLSSISGGLLNRAALVTFAVAAVEFVNNPLLQRSISLVPYDEVTSIPANLSIAQNIPDGWFGSANYSDWTDGGAFDANSISTAQSWKINKTINTESYGSFWCNGTCEGLVPGIGFTASCDQPTSSTMDMLSIENEGAIGFAVQYQNQIDKQANASIFYTTSRFISNITDPCIATITSQRCSVQLATVFYPIQIQNSTLTLSKYEPRKVIARFNNSSADLQDHGYGLAGPLWGLMAFAGMELSANSTITTSNLSITPGMGSYLIYNVTQIAEHFEIVDPEMFSEYSIAHCALQWTDPMPYILESMDEFIFRAALSAGNGTKAPSYNITGAADVQTFQMQDRKMVLKYRTNRDFAILAISIMLIGLVAVLGLLYGFWELEREVTLSPLEIAWAFRSPIFTDTTGVNPGITQILKHVERTRVVSRKGLIFAIGNVEELPSRVEEPQPIQN